MKWLRRWWRGETGMNRFDNSVWDVLWSAGTDYIGYVPTRRDAQHRHGVMLSYIVDRLVWEREQDEMAARWERRSLRAETGMAVVV